jgi:hypothetical protein
MKGINLVLVPSKQNVSVKKGPESVERQQTKLKLVHAPMENRPIDSLDQQDEVFETCSLSLSGSPSESKSQTGKSRGSVYIPINKRDDNLQVMECPDRISPLH